MRKSIIAGVLSCVLLVSCSSEVDIPSFSVINITLDEGDVSRPTVAVSKERGSVNWSWIRKDQDGWNVYVSSLDETSGDRTVPVRVNHIPGNANPHSQAPAQIAIGSEGNLYVVWTNSLLVEGRRFPASNLLFSRSEDGGETWSPEIAVNSDSDGPPSGHTFHNIVTLENGALVVSWIDSRERDKIAALNSDLGHDNPDSPASHEMMHSAQTDESGREVGSQIWISRSLDGGRSFEETTIADHNACPCCRTNLAVDEAGAIYLTWRHEFENGARDIVIARSDDNAVTFSEPVRVSNDNWVIEACPHAGPGLAVDESGNVHVSWYTAADSGVGLFRAISTNRASTFQPREAVFTDQTISHGAFSLMAPGTFAIASEVVSPKSIVISVLSNSDQSREPQEIGKITGSTPSFAGNGQISALAYSNGDSIMARVWVPESLD